MADSTRKKIVDAILTTLRAVSGIKVVTDDPQVWESLDASKQPRLYLNMGTGTHTRIAYLHDTSPDMEAEYTVVVEGVVQTRTSSTLDASLDAAISGTEKGFEALTVSGVTIVEALCSTIHYAKDVEGCYGIFRAEFMLKYLFNHLAP